MPRTESARRSFARVLIVLALAPIAGSGCGATINEYLVVAKKGNDVGDHAQVRDAVLGIGTELHQRQVAGFEFHDGERAAVEFLRAVARSHADASCRMVALSMLAKLRPEPEHVDLFLAALGDHHFGVRWQASEALVRHGDEGCAEPLARHLAGEARSEVVVNIVRALAEIGGRRSLETLLEILLDSSGRYRKNELGAYDGIVAISGRDYPIDDRAAWQAYFDAEFRADPEPDDAAPGAAPDGDVEAAAPSTADDPTAPESR